MKEIELTEVGVGGESGCGAGAHQLSGADVFGVGAAVAQTSGVELSWWWNYV